jgi:hypothetical protein
VAANSLLAVDAYIRERTVAAGEPREMFHVKRDGAFTVTYCHSHSGNLASVRTSDWTATVSRETSGAYLSTDEIRAAVVSFPFAGRRKAAIGTAPRTEAHYGRLSAHQFILVVGIERADPAADKRRR